MLKSRRRIFRKIFAHNLWGDSESISGPGSTLIYTKNLRDNLPKLISEFNIQTVLDGPCGDFNWMQLVAEECPLIRFIGVDIVSELVEANKKKYARLNNCSFQNLDICHNKLPEADLMIVRDCLFHLSFESISAFLTNFEKSEIKYLLTTSHHESKYSQNRDIRDGEFREIFLKRPPFNFPSESLFEIQDWIPPHPKRSLYLWSRSDIQATRLLGHQI